MNHREMYPEQYEHPLIGKRVRVKPSIALMRDKGEWTVKRVMPSRFGTLVSRPPLDAYRVEDVEIIN